jgi:hypothetical protein
VVARDLCDHRLLQNKTYGTTSLKSDNSAANDRWEIPNPEASGEGARRTGVPASRIVDKRIRVIWRTKPNAAEV